MRPKKITIVDKPTRNALIRYKYVYDGLTVYELSKEFRLTPQQIANVVRENINDKDREEHRRNYIKKMFNNLSLQK